MIEYAYFNILKMRQKYNIVYDEVIKQFITCWEEGSFFLIDNITLPLSLLIISLCSCTDCEGEIFFYSVDYVIKCHAVIYPISMSNLIQVM